MQHYNDLVRDKVQSFRRDCFDNRKLTFDNYTQHLSLLALPALHLAGLPSAHTTSQLLCRSLSAVVVNSLIVVPIKHTVSEWRPDHRKDNSFPSGHTSFGFAGAELLRLEYGRDYPLVPAAGFSVAALTGFMRIYNDRHWTSDVLAGAAVGLLAADLAWLINEKLLDRLLPRLFPKTVHFLDACDSNPYLLQ